MEEQAERLKARWILATIAGILVAWVAFGTIPILVSDNWAVRGQVGDMFGAANALFSALALAGVIYTIALQRVELRLQRRELELTRNELQRTAAAQEASERNLAQQARALESSARLNALNAIVDHYRRLANVSASVTKTQYRQERLAEVTQQLEEEVRRVIDGTAPKPRSDDRADGTADRSAR